MAIFATSDGTELFYKDWGSGQPLVFHHGWPLSADDWDAQIIEGRTMPGSQWAMSPVLSRGRRGSGRPNCSSVSQK